MKKLFACCFVSIAIAAAGAASAQPAEDPFLPAGPGRDRVAAICTSCHAARAFGQIRESATAWRHQVSEMILIGAQVSPDDLETIVTYLSTHMGPGVRLPGPPPAAVDLPPGDGRVLVLGSCTLCHGLDRVAAAKRSPAEWDHIVERMAFYGAPVKDDQRQTIVAYLKQNFTAK